MKRLCIWLLVQLIRCAVAKEEVRGTLDGTLDEE